VPPSNVFYTRVSSEAEHVQYYGCSFSIYPNSTYL